ncbi:MerR family transcriptional regulator [Desulforamulus aquiferis]|uniref:MerR family transcriptional regulator n=1 Tax=Desulforamulus aquiferis TaxID=1397668 RepID=A0AAW7ZJK8_9FIRM|nr:MerR family transcriptional regulator [Desulforamulus aquiferis]MDO7789130.1 MerR family transcriptional regulator [Desulforamulus aquiferis]
MINEYTPILNIGIVAETVRVHPETLRIWEKNGLVIPNRRNKQRLYSNMDLKRLKFIRMMIQGKGLNIAGMQMLLGMYPCWTTPGCSGGGAMGNPNKPCWMAAGMYCIGSDGLKVAK